MGPSLVSRDDWGGYSRQGQLHGQRHGVFRVLGLGRLLWLDH